MLLVDAAQLASELNGNLSQSIESVPTLFHALGAIAASTAREPVDSVVLSAAQLSSPAHVVADSIHRVDPAVNLYLANDSDDSTLRNDVNSAGFDQIFNAPISADLILAILGGEKNDSPPSDLSPPEPPALSTSTNLQHQFDPPDNASKVPTSSFDERVTTAHAAVPDSAAPHNAAHETVDAGSGAAIDLPTQLGDTDLVATILKDPTQLAHVAVRLLQQETQIDDLQFIATDSQQNIPTDATRFEVKHDDVTLGHLVSHEAAGITLESWSGWFGQWLALAHQVDHLQELAAVDPLTGAWNRRHFDEFLRKTLDEARQERRQLNILVFDVDDLKKYNDRHGHEAGDIVLKETVRLMQSVVRKGDKVFRIGGDEFVVVFSDTEPPRKRGSSPIESIEAIIRRFQSEIAKMRFPKLGVDAPGELSISAGLATFPWDGTEPDALLNAADRLAIESKRRGKNALTIGSGAKLQSPGNFVM